MDSMYSLQQAVLPFAVYWLLFHALIALEAAIHPGAAIHTAAWYRMPAQLRLLVLVFAPIALPLLHFYRLLAGAPKQ